MTEFAGRIAVVTGGGSGMGRELVRQLVAEACNVAMCDVSPTGLAETQRLCEAAGLPQGLRVTTHIADVADRTQVERFRDDVAGRHQTDKIHLLFNNAGISGGGSMVTHSSDEWERTFNICWGGVYNCTRAFLPMLQNAEEGHIVNTRSINGFWASVGPRIPHTAYSAAKFAVKGFTEALITDLQINAPHIKCSVVMPGPIGTSIRANTRKIHSGDRESDAIDAAGLAQARERFALLGRDLSQLSDDQLRNLVAELERRFRDKALTSAAQAATIILDGVKALNGTIAGVVLVHAAHGLVIAVWIAAAAFAAVDGELEFAARNLGASPLRTALTVTLPLAAPGLMAAAIFVFLESLDEFTGTYFVGVPDVTTLPLIMFTASLAGNLMIAFGRSRAGGTASPDRSRSSKACRKRCQAVTGEIPQGRGTTLSHLPSEVGIRLRGWG